MAYGYSIDDLKQMLDPSYDWSLWHTRQLLDLRLEGLMFNPTSPHEFEVYKAFHMRVKEILATREHIPNKLEAKQLRQAKAKAQRNR